MKPFLILLLCIYSTCYFAQHHNRLDRKGRRTGKWITYTDSCKARKLTEGRYRKGEPVGRFYYYTMEGVLERREQTRFKTLRTTLYYPDKKVRFKGKARIDNEADRIHYYFFGKWKYYDENGRLLKYCYYEKGKLVRTVYADKNNKTNDSLVNFLNLIDTVFKAKNADLVDSIYLSAFNVQRRERLQKELYARDTLSFRQLDLLFSKYGYPSRERAGDAAVIPFYILSFAPADIKEKYLGLLKQAADRGDLEWKFLAYFIDKMKVDKQEKQVYGSQYYLKQGQIVYYPVEDPERLQERRTKAGL